MNAYPTHDPVADASGESWRWSGAATLTVLVCLVTAAALVAVLDWWTPKLATQAALAQLNAPDGATRLQLIEQARRMLVNGLIGGVIVLAVLLAHGLARSTAARPPSDSPAATGPPPAHHLPTDTNHDSH